MVTIRQSNVLPPERCCFCRKPTLFWYGIGEDGSYAEAVPCCRTCAGRAKPEDMPTRKAWRRREEIVTGE